MARTFTREQIALRILEEADAVGDGHISTAELNKITNSSVSETWDFICQTGLGEKYVRYVDFNTVAGTQEYPFDTMVVPNDHQQGIYRIHQVYVNEGNGQYRPITRINPAEVLSFRAPPSAVPMRLYYILSAPVWSEDSTDDDETFDGINGWEEHSILTGAMKIKSKKDDSYRQLQDRKREVERRILTMGMVDMGQPARVVRRRHSSVNPWALYTHNVNAYVVRGDKLELLQLHGYIP
jgi:hypothetical protein